MTEQEERKYPEVGQAMREFYERAAEASIADFLHPEKDAAPKLSDLIAIVEKIAAKGYSLKVENGFVVISFEYSPGQHACGCGGDCKCKEAQQ